MNLLFNSDIMNLLLKNRRPNVVILEFFNCRWGCGEAGKMRKVEYWCGWEGGWESGTGFSAVRENLENNTFFKKSGKNKGKKQNYDKVREFQGGAPFSVHPSVQEPYII